MKTEQQAMIRLTRHTEHGYSFSKTYSPTWRRCKISDLPSNVILHYGFGDAEDEMIEYQIILFNGTTVIHPLLLDDVQRELHREASVIWGIANATQSEGYEDLTLDKCKQVAINRGAVKSLSVMLDILNGLMQLTEAVQLVVNDLGYSVKITSVPSIIIEIGQTVNIEPYAIQCAEWALGDSKS